MYEEESAAFSEDADADLDDYLRELKSYFKDVDRNRDGHLSRAELYGAGTREEALTEDDVDELVQIMGGDRGGISWHEYVHSLGEETRAFGAHQRVLQDALRRAQQTKGRRARRSLLAAAVPDGPGRGAAHRRGGDEDFGRDTADNVDDGDDGDDGEFFVVDQDELDELDHDFDPDDSEARPPHRRHFEVTHGWHADEEEEGAELG